MTETNFDARRTPSATVWRFARGFMAGFVAVLIFHQAMLGILHLIGVTPGIPWAFRPVPPFGVPQVLSLAFWGGVWGIVFVSVEKAFPRDGAGYWIAAGLFGAIALTLVAWFVVAPLKGAPVAGGWQPASMATALLVNGAWGLGTALLLRLLERRSSLT
ncbi:MAG TPA: hypothetical protein VD978_17315 [Azospirillum sp.]|nr:hypothetical protein [Azospirillum sp.]